MSPVIVAGNEQNSNAGSSLEITVTVAVAEVVECLLERTAPIANAKFEYCPVIQQITESNHLMAIRFFLFCFLTDTLFLTSFGGHQCSAQHPRQDRDPTARTCPAKSSESSQTRKQDQVTSVQKYLPNYY